MIPRPRRQRGLSLPEILVSLVAGALVTAAGYKAFQRFSHQSRAQASIAKAQSELVTLQASLEKELRRTLFNMPPKCPGRNAAGVLDTLRAIVVETHTGGPDGITVRGNFDEAGSLLAAPLPRGTTQMRVRSGGTRGFAVGDTLILRDAERTEWCLVTGVSASANVIRTPVRLFDFPIGAEVIKVSSAAFLPRGGSLFLHAERRRRTLTPNLHALEFSAQGFDGAWDSSPPWDIAEIQALRYVLKTRVPKPGNRGWLYRDAEGVITLRNAR